MRIGQNELKNVISVIKKYFSFFIVGLLFSCVIYFVLITNQLVNSEDGLWEYSYYKAGSWSLSIGRWFWLYLDRLRFGISTEPLTSLITLACFSLGFVFVLDLYEMGKQKISYLVSMIFLSSTVVCISLSYRFMSPTFGLAFLLNVLAAWIVVRWENKILSVIASGCLIALAMGLYQAYIGCTCVVLVGYFLYVLQREDVSVKQIGGEVLKAFLGAVLGGALYVGILNLHLAVFHLNLVDYNGANTYSLSNSIKNFPASIDHTYRVFSRYFFEGYFKNNVLQAGQLYPIVLLLLLVVLIFGFVKVLKNNKGKAILYLLFIGIIPVAGNAVLLIATAAWTSLQMTAPMALCIPMLMCVAVKIIGEQKKWLVCVNIVAAVVLYGNVYQVQLDQNAMLEGRTATMTMTQNIVDDLQEMQLLDPEMKYCVVGNPAGNELFGTSVLFDKANGYARFGSWNLYTNCNRRSWQGAFNYLCGVNLHMCIVPEYDAAISDAAVADMPVYPYEGYIAQIGDVVVIKVVDELD